MQEREATAPQFQPQVIIYDESGCVDLVIYVQTVLSARYMTSFLFGFLLR